jgi:hypothetical protein
MHIQKGRPPANLRKKIVPFGCTLLVSATCIAAN